MSSTQKLATSFRQVLAEHENGALGGIDLADALAQSVSVSPPTAERIDGAATTTASLLDEYGQALRGAWGDIDGRSEKLALLELSAAIREHGNDPLPEDKVQKLRDDLNVCQEGGGHWGWYCDETWTECEPEGADR